jgi:hypothetical protein
VRAILLSICVIFLVASCYEFNNPAEHGNTSVPAAPSDLELSNEATLVELSWTDNSDNETGFSIERKSETGGTTMNNFEEIGSVGSDITSYTDEGPFSTGSKYTYRVRAFNGTGYSNYSNEASITF